MDYACGDVKGVEEGFFFCRCCWLWGIIVLFYFASFPTWFYHFWYMRKLFYLVTLVVGGGWCIGSELIGVGVGVKSSLMSVGCVYVCLSHIIAHDDYLLDERRKQSRITIPCHGHFVTFSLIVIDIHVAINLMQ